MISGKYFEELKPGDEYVSRRRTITETDVVIFTSLVGLNNPLFTDEIYAREKGFGSRVAPGPLTISMAMGLTDDIIYGTTAAALGLNSARFHAPVKPGDTLNVKTTVLDSKPSSSQPDRGMVTLRHEVINQEGKKVCTFERTLMILKKA